MTPISEDLIDSLVELNNKIINNVVTHPASLAILLEEIATDAWLEAEMLGAVTWQEAENIQSPLRIDP